jgi:hypothetical protein
MGETNAFKILDAWSHSNTPLGSSSLVYIKLDIGETG